MNAVTLGYWYPSVDATTDSASPTKLSLVDRPARYIDAGINVYTNPGDSANAFANHYMKLRALEKNAELWPEDGEPPTAQSIRWASVVLQALQEESVQPTRVVASAEGGVAVCFVKGNRYSDIECLNSGAILGVTSNRHDRPIVWEIEQNSRGLAQACSRIREFIR